MIAVALKNNIHAYRYNLDVVDNMMHLVRNKITALCWNSSGTKLAIGTEMGEIYVSDINESFQFLWRRIDRSSRADHIIYYITWHSSTDNDNDLLIYGTKTGDIVFVDVQNNRIVEVLTGVHDSIICKIKLSPDNQVMASGSNDNFVHMWDMRKRTQKLCTLVGHTSAVKAIDFCPWRKNLLLTGGGTCDRTLRLWDLNNINNGVADVRSINRDDNDDNANAICLKTILVAAQITDVIWLPNSKHFISSHGLGFYGMICWKYPEMDKKNAALFLGHTKRVSSISLSPKADKMVSGSEDESIRIWDVPFDHNQQRVMSSPVIYKNTIHKNKNKTHYSTIR